MFSFFWVPLPLLMYLQVIFYYYYKAKKEKDREDRERRKGKQRREKEGGHESGKEESHKRDKGENDNAEFEIQSSKENRRSEDVNRKQQKQHRSPEYEMEKRGLGDLMAMQHSSGHESDEGQDKRHKRDHCGDSHREGDYEELEDGEFGDDMIDHNRYSIQTL
ncbi:hypothetical protein RJT34_06409 [Clitoria ternatea]|uniref:Uncharacterized protein n=1 Tax=Clitoria ternatea TaxID=43366 RepID=A0AAN9K298_CLITE